MLHECDCYFCVFAKLPRAGYGKCSYYQQPCARSHGQCILYIYSSRPMEMLALLLSTNRLR